MTLLIAKRFSDGVAMIGDTCGTLKHEQLIPSPKDWAIKTHILSPNLCVGFAGITELARQGIAEIRHRQVTELEGAVEILTRHHLKSLDIDLLEWNVDFLVASSSRIFEVAKGMCNDRGTVGYVGKVAAWKKIESAVAACSSAREVCHVLRSIYFDDKLRSVGGTAVAAVFRKNRFEYLDDLYHTSGLQVITVGQDGWYSATAVPGGEYMEEIVVDNERLFVGVYFFLGKCGVGFQLDSRGEMNARLSPKGIRMSAREFEKWCNAEFGCHVVAIHARIYENHPESNLTVTFKVAE